MDLVVSTEPVDILLVEDQPHDAELALRALKKLNLDERVSLVRDGAGALDFIFGRGNHANRDLDDAPRLILLDLKLPKMSGIDVLRALKSDENPRHIPIIVLTSSGEACDVDACYNLGANSYVVKPVDFAQFTETVQQIGTYWLNTNEPPR